MGYHEWYGPTRLRWVALHGDVDAEDVRSFRPEDILENGLHQGERGDRAQGCDRGVIGRGVATGERGSLNAPQAIVMTACNWV